MVKHDHLFKAEKAGKLISEARKEMMPETSIIEMMEIGKQDVVADFGAGNGYFTLPIAQFTEGKVIAIDAEPKMLELLETRAKEHGIQSIECHVAAIDDTPMEDSTVDKVLISRVIHHAFSVEQTLEEIKRILVADGELMIIEFYKDATIDGPPMEMRIGPEEMVSTLEEAGFEATVTKLSEAEYGVKATIKT